MIGGEFELKKPTKTGFTFYGWYTDPEYTNQVYNTNEFTDDVVLYAKWDLTTFEKAFQEVAYAYYMR
ncbi:InlB B-repeat-containing protein [bacterium]|nr:InlB B-repeat-containing protein [bacterium]